MKIFLFYMKNALYEKCERMKKRALMRKSEKKQENNINIRKSVRWCVTNVTLVRKTCKKRKKLYD